MAGNMNRGSGGAIHHWRHGWIPLTHKAALQKAGGSQIGAARIMQRHGITDGPKSLHSVDRSNGGKGKPDAPAAKTPHEAPHTLKPGEIATVRGVDHMGQPTTFTGKVMANGEASSFKKGRTTGGQPLRSIAIERQDGSKRQNVVYVPDPDRGESKRGAAAEREARMAEEQKRNARAHEAARARATPSAGDYTEAAAQWQRENPGKKIAGNETQVNRLAEDIARRKYVQQGTKGDTVTQAAAERERIRKAAANANGSPAMAARLLAEKRAGDGAAKVDESRAKVRDLPAEGNFSRSHSETFMGEKITVRKTEQGRHETLINGEPFSAGYGSRNKHAVAELDQARKSIETMKSSSDPKYRGLYGMKSDKPGAADAPSAPAPKYSDAEIARGYDMRGKPIPAEPAPTAKRATVEHSGDGTTLSIERGDTEAREAAKAAGFRWSSNLGAWYLPRTQHESTRRAKVAQFQRAIGDDNVELNDGGHGNTNTAAEREAAKVAQAASRAERMDARSARLTAESERRRAAADAISEHIPFGQPILLGHHSQGRAERDNARIVSNTRKSNEAYLESKDAAAAAERARKTAAGVDPLARQRRVDRNSAELRSVEKKLADDDMLLKMSPESQAKLARVSGVFKPLDSDYRARLEASRDRLRDEIDHDKSQISASGVKQVTSKDVTSGDLVTYRGRTYIVTKVNKTTVSVPSGYSWDDKVPLNQVTKHVPLSTQSDSAIRTAFDRATDAKVKSALRAELLRRGLTAA